MHKGYVSLVDTRWSNKLRPLIRFINAWKYYQSVPIASFYLELRIAKYGSERPAIRYSIAVERVLSRLYNIRLAQIQDPMRISGYISPCRSSSATSASISKLATAVSRARKAREAELEGRISDAFGWWDKLFNYEFPNYR